MTRDAAPPFIGIAVGNFRLGNRSESRCISKQCLVVRVHTTDREAGPDNHKLFHA
jgi:hypothetical protein